MTISPRTRLIIAGTLFLGWMGWLSYAALSKSRAPVVSRAQAAATTHAVVAIVDAGPEGKPLDRVKVEQVLLGTEPAIGAEIDVNDLHEATGFAGPGTYLLPLQRVGPTRYALVGQQTSPGFELAGVGSPIIYRWSPDVEAQARKLFAR